MRGVRCVALLADSLARIARDLDGLLAAMDLGNRQQLRGDVRRLAAVVSEKIIRTKELIAAR